MISIIHPSRGRAKRAKETYDKWMSAAQQPQHIQYILSLDIDDGIVEYCNLFSALPNVSILQNNNRSAVDAINKAAAQAEKNILIVVSDDFEAPEHWDKQIIDAVIGKRDWILQTKDTESASSWIITLPIMDKKYYYRFGYIYNPEYLHMFCDTEMTCVAELLDRKIIADIPFSHKHYSTGKNEKDAVSEKADSTFISGSEIFTRRYKNNFGLENSPGKITSQAIIDWMKERV